MNRVLPLALMSAVACSHAGDSARRTALVVEKTALRAVETLEAFDLPHQKELLKRPDADQALKDYRTLRDRALRALALASALALTLEPLLATIDDGGKASDLSTWLRDLLSLWQAASKLLGELGVSVPPPGGA